MPQVKVGEHLVDAFNDIGRAVSNGFGLSPVSWSEISAYADATGLIETATEKQVLRSMSVAYVDGLNVGKDPLGIPPMLATQRSPAQKSS